MKYSYHNPPPSSMMKPMIMKRSRSTESLERALKKYKPFQQPSAEEESTTPSPPPAVPQPWHANTTLYPPQQQSPPPYVTSHLLHHPHPIENKVIKSLSISTRSTSYASEQSSPIDHRTDIAKKDTHPQENYYRSVNHFLYNVHVARHGDPETRESWWEHTDTACMQPQEDMLMDEDHAYYEQQQRHDYESNNAILRQAFLMRQQQQQQQHQQHD
ncbi:hypothetical protein BDF20DRAFT_867526 [Mycotypha africana]|uniref:uncharacterized protein n=1 Tax=Mycotypha africana TaxID=64632 RepID=UPI00230087FB|nr:uncharacterized protein BDF20DRAFT_867526 [Mycotypha africana]KAI8979076.1 hypothetical protein BDF20DRAFT_867526 [Mycotypha africana]